MNIVEPSAEDVSLRDAMELAGVTDKTVRRAVQAGELPRRYVQTAHGPMLLFQRAEIERWCAERKRQRRRRAAAPAPTVIHAAVCAAVRQMNAALTKSQAAIADVSRQLEQYEKQVASARITIDRLTAQMTFADLAAGKDTSEPTDDGAEMLATASGRRLS